MRHNSDRTRRKSVFAGLLAAAALLATGCPGTAGPGGGSDDTYTLVLAWHDDFADQMSGRAMSADGRYVAYRDFTTAPRGGSVQLFDRTTGTTTELATVGPDRGIGGQGPMISADGSTVFYVAPNDEPHPPNIGYYESLFRYDVPSGETDEFVLPIDGSFGYSASTEAVSLSADGSTVAFDSGQLGTIVWTEATGFQTIAPVGGGNYHEIDETGLSPSGRYLASYSIVRLPDPDGWENGQPEKLQIVVRDLQTDTVSTTWESGERVVYYPLGGANPWDFRLASTLDDGSVLFSYNSNAGVFRLEPGTGVAVQTAGYQGVVLTGASWNGRFVSYTGPSSILPNLSNVNEITDRTTASVERASAYADPRLTKAVQISDDGRYVLLTTSEPGRVPGPAGLYLWDRGA